MYQCSHIVIMRMHVLVRRAGHRKNEEKKPKSDKWKKKSKAFTINAVCIKWIYSPYVRSVKREANKTAAFWINLFEFVLLLFALAQNHPFSHVDLDLS